MRRPFAVPLLLAFVACAPPAGAPTASPANTEPAAVQEAAGGYVIRFENEAALSAALNSTPERVWSILPSVYQALRIPTEVYDPRTRSIGTQRFTELRIGDTRTVDLVRCGNEGAGPSAVSAYRVRLSIITTVRARPGNVSSLTTQVTATGTPVEGTSTATVRCVSTGEIERRILALTSEQLQR